MSELDKDWLIFNEYIQNDDNKNVIIDNASLIIDIQNKSDDIFNVLKQNNSVLKVNNEGVFIIQNQSSFPEAENSLIFKEGRFYISS